MFIRVLYKYTNIHTGRNEWHEGEVGVPFRDFVNFERVQTCVHPEPTFGRFLFLVRDGEWVAVSGAGSKALVGRRRGEVQLETHAFALVRYEHEVRAPRRRRRARHCGVIRVRRACGRRWRGPLERQLTRFRGDFVAAVEVCARALCKV